MISAEQRKAWRALAERTSPGPWTATYNEPTADYVISGPENAVADSVFGDAYFIAESPMMVLALLDDLERAERVIEAARDVVDHWGDHFGESALQASLRAYDATDEGAG